MDFGARIQSDEGRAGRVFCMLVVAVLAIGSMQPAQAKDPGAKDPGEIENHVLVTGDVGFGFTRKTVDCFVSDGKLVAFRIPGLTDETAPPPDLTGHRLQGAWEVEVHTPRIRFFKSENAAGVVVVKPKQDPSTWKIKVHNVRMTERLVLRGKVDHAYVSTVLRCTSITTLPPRK